MARYIDADALKEKFTSKWILDRIDQHPTADVMEVVRCKDCKRYTKNCFCTYWQSVGAVAQLASFDYCSYGERREDAEVH